MKTIVSTLALAALAGAPALAMQQPAAGQGNAARTPPAPHTLAGRLTLYEMTNYNGETFVADGPRYTVHTDWNIRSISIHPGERWEICARPRFRDCIILDRSVHDATMIGVQGQIGSARPAPAAGPAAPPAN